MKAIIFLLLVVIIGMTSAFLSSPLSYKVSGEGNPILMVDAEELCSEEDSGSWGLHGEKSHVEGHKEAQKDKTTKGKPRLRVHKWRRMRSDRGLEQSRPSDINRKPPPYVTDIHSFENIPPEYELATVQHSYRRERAFITERYIRKKALMRQIEPCNEFGQMIMSTQTRRN